MNITVTKEKMFIFVATIVLLSATFGIKLAQHLAYVKHDSISVRFASMYEYIIQTNISYIESLILEDRPGRIPSLENHMYFINFGQILSHDDPDLANRINYALSNLRVFQENYEFLAQNVTPYEVANARFVPTQDRFSRDPDPVITYNDTQMRYSEYVSLRDETIAKRQDQLSRLADLLTQYLNQYRELSAILRATDD